jgi:proline dehydrogenase
MAEHLESMSIFAGTHNELSSYKLMEIMQEKGIAKYDTKIWESILRSAHKHQEHSMRES